MIFALSASILVMNGKGCAHARCNLVSILLPRCKSAKLVYDAQPTQIRNNNKQQIEHPATVQLPSSASSREQGDVHAAEDGLIPSHTLLALSNSSPES